MTEDGTDLTEGDQKLTFVADVMLGRLAKSLRMLGYDVLYSDSASDPELSLIAAREGRTLLTRDRELAASRLAAHAVLVRSDHLGDQLTQIVGELDLSVGGPLFTRCLICNTEVLKVTKSDVEGSVPPYVLATQESFSRCPTCGRVYWSATHVRRAREWLARLFDRDVIAGGEDDESDAGAG